jgi:hypothetical protein
MAYKVCERHHHMHDETVPCRFCQEEQKKPEPETEYEPESGSE